MTADLSVYERNCKLLVPALREMGYHVAETRAFYLFPSLEPDDLAFSERAKQSRLAAGAWLRLQSGATSAWLHCVQTEMIQRALPSSRRWRDSYR